EEYMRAVIRGAHLDESSEEVERRIALRMARQVLLTQEHAPRLWAVVDEGALRRPVGGPDVLRVQLERLIEAAKLPNVRLQVLPFAAGAHPAMVGAFSILRFPEPELPDVVYLEHLTNAIYLDKEDDVDQYLHVMETICVRGAAPDRTVELLSRILKESGDAWGSRAYSSSSKSPSFTPSRNARTSASLKINAGPGGCREFRTAAWSGGRLAPS